MNKGHEMINNLFGRLNSDEETAFSISQSDQHKFQRKKYSVEFDFKTFHSGIKFSKVMLSDSSLPALHALNALLLYITLIK